MDIVYSQSLKELLQISSYFKEQLIILVSNEIQEKKVKQAGQVPCYVIDDKSDLNNFKKKKTAVIGGSIKDNEFAVKVKANFLLQPSNTKQFFDLGLAKKLFDNNTTVVLMFEELLDKNSFDRHLFWKNFLEVVRYCKKKGTRFVVASGNKDPLNLKAPRVRECIAQELGLTREVAKKFSSECV